MTRGYFWGHFVPMWQLFVFDNEYSWTEFELNPYDKRTILQDDDKQGLYGMAIMW